ncbi:MAG: TonB-dependent receptor [Pseudoxanthomonas sp.]
MNYGNAKALRRSRLCAALIAAIALPGAGHALAQNADGQTQAPAQGEARTLDKVTVTGSRIARSQVEGPSPVTVISAEQIEAEGFVSVNDALKTLTQNFGTVQNELNSAGGFTPNGSPVNLRGLGPGRTLLLINGRRAADYPFPYNGQSNFQNFGNIPTAAVDRIELVAGGASAIYGSDAVAGVINIILKKNYEGNVLQLRTGTTTTGGGDYLDLQWVGGKTGDNWSITYALQKFNDETVYAYQRDFMDSRADNPLPDADLGPVPVSTLRISRTGTNVPNTYIAPPAGACARFGGEYVDYTFRTRYSATHPQAGQLYTLGNACGYWTDVGYQSIANGNDDYAGYLFANLDLSNGMELWASAQAYYSKSDLTGGLEAILGPHTDGVGVTQTFFATNPTINSNVTVQRILTPQEVGGIEATQQKFTEKSLDVAVGARGSFGERFDWDFTLGRADYKADRTRPRLDGSAVTEWFFGQRLNTTGTPRYLINLDRWYTPLTPEQYRSMSSILKYDAHSWVNQASFVLSGDLFELPAGPLGFAAVVEGTSQGYKLRSPEGILPTNRTVYNLTGTNGGGERDRYAIGAEFRIPVFSMLDLSLSGRWDKYDDVTNVDDAKTWGAGIEFRPLDTLLFRGNYATSFKAPDMHFVYNEGSGSFSTVLDTYRCLNAGLVAGSSACNTTTYTYSVFATSMGEPTLEEEKGKSWSAGLVWDITDSMSVSADYYDIRLEGAVTTLSSTFILDAEGGCLTGLTRARQPYQFAPDSAFCQEILSRVTRTAAPGEPTDRVTGIRSGPVNQAYQRVTGIDAAFNWRLDTDRLGDFRWQVSWTHTIKSQRQTFATDPLEADWRDDPGNFDFRSRVRGSVGWSLDDWSANVFATRYGSLPNWQETGRIAPYIVWNVNVGKEITENLDLTLFVNNVFNKFHPEDAGYNTYPYFWRAFSPMGREISAQVEYKF